jgi:hypothetical protein
VNVYSEDVDDPNLHLVLFWEYIVFRSGVVTGWF